MGPRARAPVPISAQNGEGLAGLAEALLAYAPAEDAGRRPTGRRCALAIVGRPNVGKSSLINRLIEDERLLTGPEPGLTRDAVTVAWQWQGRRIELVDTAGLRRRARIEPGALEQLSSRSALAALRQAEVVVLLVDASAPWSSRTSPSRTVRRRRARLVVAANKWDLVEEPQAAMAVLRERLEGRLPHLKGVAGLPISVRTGQISSASYHWWWRPTSAGRNGSPPPRSTAGWLQRPPPIRPRWPRGAASRSATSPR